MQDNTNTQVLIAGAIAAFTVDLLVYPLDTIKTRYQSQDFRNAFVESTTQQGAQTTRQLFKGLYQGIGSVIFATLPAAGLFFMTYESAKSALHSGMPSSTPKPLVHAIASSSAELASCVVLAPAEIVKQNAQMLQRSGEPADKWATSIKALRAIRGGSAGSARNLWAGYVALVARNLPFTAINFPLFEFFRAQIWDWRLHTGAQGVPPDVEAADRGGREGRDHSILETGLVTGASACLSSAMAAFATTPADVIKTRIMLAAGDSSIADGRRNNSMSKKQNVSGLSVFREIVREKGLRGLFRGGSLRASWAAIGGGLYLGSYEAAKVRLGRPSKEARSDGGF
ncbi:Mitochondrial carrier domain containing protein [Rhypophila decipiens]